MKSWKASIALAVLLPSLHFPALGQQQSASAFSDPIGRFLGTWQLHMKDGRGIPERESLTIERTGKVSKLRIGPLSITAPCFPTGA